MYTTITLSFQFIRLEILESLFKPFVPEMQNDIAITSIVRVILASVEKPS